MSGYGLLLIPVAVLLILEIKDAGGSTEKFLYAVILAFFGYVLLFNRKMLIPSSQRQCPSCSRLILKQEKVCPNCGKESEPVLQAAPTRLGAADAVEIKKQFKIIEKRADQALLIFMVPLVFAFFFRGQLGLHKVLEKSENIFPLVAIFGGFALTGLLIKMKMLKCPACHKPLGHPKYVSTISSCPNCGVALR